MKGLAILMQTLMNWLKMTKFKNFMTYEKLKNCAKKNGTILKKRKAKYEKEREIKEKVHKKIFDAQKNNQEDELYATDQEVKKFIR